MKGNLFKVQNNLATKNCQAGECTATGKRSVKLFSADSLNLIQHRPSEIGIGYAGENGQKSLDNQGYD